MSRVQSRTQRKAAFLEVANRMYEDLEDWYEQHPEASFGTIETEARRLRRRLMGTTLQVLINGRDTGYQLEPPACPQCGQPMKFERYSSKQVYGLEGDTELERAYYTCDACQHQTFFPLDQKLQLRGDHWSEGAARVAARQGLQAKSFKLAAEAYTDAVGGTISGDSLQRITEGWGTQVASRRQAEAEYANLPGQREESPRARRVPESRPIVRAANLSTDGAMVLVREEGWKEVKVVAVSAVTVKTAGERALQTLRPSRRAADPLA